MDLKVILDATPKHREKLTIKRGLRDNLCISIGRGIRS